MPKIFRAIGAMTGTSMDGLDLAFLETDGRATLKFGPTASFSFSEAERALLREAMVAAKGLSDRSQRPGALAEAERFVTQKHVWAIQNFLDREKISADSVDVVGFHGQTVLHRPEFGLTVQIGDGAGLARAIGVDVVYDLRARDVAAGGQGAPLVPAYHQALAQNCGVALPMMMVNLGGVANFTFVGTGGDPIACDCGPGNALLDDFLRARLGVAMDENGVHARAGRVDAAALETLLDHRFFDAPPPKSLDRNAFALDAVEKLSTEDGAATLCAFTAQALARHMRFLPAPPKMIVLCGGGAKNPALVGAIGRATGLPTRRAEDFGWDSQAIEAQAFAYLAVRSIKGLPLTFATTTGASAPTAGGVLALAG